MRPAITLAVGLLVSLLATAEPARADRWISLGPIVDRSVLRVEIDTTGPPLLYALDEAGVLRSRDGGITWELGGDGLTHDLRMGHLTADSHRSEALYAAEFSVGVYRSLDGGAHWHPARNEGLPALPRPSDLLPHPTRPTTLYMSTWTDWIFVSEDRGDTWRPAGTATDRSHSIYELAADPEDPDTLYAAGVDDDRAETYPIAFKSEDGGATWQQLHLPAPYRFGGIVTGFAVSSGGPAALYIAMRHGGIARSTDGGFTWSQADSGIPVGDAEGDLAIEGLVVHPSDPLTLYASTESRSATPDGVFRTTDGGESWQLLGEWPADAPAALDFAVHPDDPSLLLAAPGPYLQPADGDGPWRSRRPALPPRSRFVTAHPVDLDVLFTDSFHADLRRSQDGGATWESFGAGLPPFPTTGYGKLVVDRRDPDTLYITGGKNLFKSGDGGLTWVESDQGLDTAFSSISGLTIDPLDSAVLYALHGGDLHRSMDGAGTWEPLFAPDGAVVTSFAPRPDDPRVLYAGSRTLGGTGGPEEVCRSTDAGGSWTCFGVGLSEGGIENLTVDPSDPGRVFATWHPSPRRTSATVLRSLDGGVTWTSLEAGLPEVEFLDLAIDARKSPSTLWAATDGRGVYRSTDGGDSWIPVLQGMGPLEVRDLSFGAGGLYAATSLGVYRLDESPEAGDPLPPAELPWITDPELPGFRFKVRIDQGEGQTLPGAREPACIPETACVSGALPGRSELFLRIVGPKPNGWLWPTLVKFSTSRIEVWIQQLSSDRWRYYDLRGASPGFDELPGLFDRFGFPPEP